MQPEITTATNILLNFSPDRFANLTPGDYCAQLVQQIPNAWHLLAQHHYNLVPLEHQNSKEVFLGEYYYRQAKEYLQSGQNALLAEQAINQALSLGNYHAMEHVCLNAVAENDFDQALAWGHCCAAIYLTPGYMLLANAYHAKSLQKTSNAAEKKQDILEAIVNINLALLLKEKSHIALRNTNWQISDESLKQLADHYAARVTLTANDKAAVLAAINQKLAERLEKPSHNAK